MKQLCAQNYGKNPHYSAFRISFSESAFFNQAPFALLLIGQLPARGINIFAAAAPYFGYYTYFV